MARPDMATREETKAQKLYVEAKTCVGHKILPNNP